MSTFNNNKVFGTALLIAGLVAALLAIAIFVKTATDGAMGGTSLTSIGVVLFGLLIAWSGAVARKGDASDNLGLLSKCLMTVGGCVAFVAIFESAGGAMEGAETMEIVTSFVISVLMGALMIFGAMKLKAGAVSASGKISWVLMVIAVALCLLSSAMEMLNPDILLAIICAANTVVFLFMLCAILTGDVRKAVGISS